jgi:hypothetical protein
MLRQRDDTSDAIGAAALAPEEEGPAGSRNGGRGASKWGWQGMAESRLTQLVVLGNVPSRITCAKTLVMSLWAVPDRETRELMVGFYKNILSGKLNRAQALRQAALTQMQDLYRPALPADQVISLAALTAQIPDRGEDVVRCDRWYSNVCRGKRQKPRPGMSE